jgi:hypothetical protein
VGTFSEVGTFSQTGGTPLKLTISTVPEPATWAMMLLGFAGLLGFAAFLRTTKEKLASA